METAAPPFEHLRLDADGRLDQDLPCLRCGYNLRGLAPDWRCPECWTAVGRSAHGDMLRFCDPAWVSKLARGMNYLWWGLALAICVPVVAPLSTAVLGKLGTRIEGLALSFIYVVLVPAMAFVAIWQLTTPDPGRLTSEPDCLPRRAVRFLIVSATVVFLVDRLLGMLGWGTGLPLLIVFLLLSIVGAAVVLSVLAYAATLARRAPDLQLARSTTTVTRGLLIATAVYAAGTIAKLAPSPPQNAATGGVAWALVMLQPMLLVLSPVARIAFFVLGLLTLWLVDQYARLLRTAARQARETWASQDYSPEQQGDSQV